jgi:hypothetical protein
VGRANLDEGYKGFKNRRIIKRHCWAFLVDRRIRPAPMPEMNFANRGTSMTNAERLERAKTFPSA